MVRGHAKAVAQERHAAKAADKAKSTKRDSSEVNCLIYFDSLAEIMFFQLFIIEQASQGGWNNYIMSHLQAGYAKCWSFADTL
jgi:hypothetical protein